MRTEPDMQARYIAATLNAIQTELTMLEVPAADCAALCNMIAGTALAAKRLADDLERAPRAVGRSLDALPKLRPEHHGNVLMFKRAKG